MIVKAKYFGDTRYEKVWEQMKLLNIEDITTDRQHKNGTIVWKLPIKNQWNNGSFIEVASFKTGYVRNNNSGYSNYQLNKRCDSEPQYYPIYEWCDEANMSVKTDKFSQFTTRTCKLIPIEIDRLEYLISYCLKNYYIKHANFVADGEYVPKWKLEHVVSSSSNDFNGHRDRINDLEEKLENMTEARDCYKNSFDDLQDGGDYRIKDLENKLDTIKRIADHG